MKLAKYKACICEGAAESAIIDILVDHDLLIFSREEMLDESVIRCRTAKKFERQTRCLVVRPAKGVQSDRWKSCQISC